MTDLWHATWKSNINSIVNYGLEPGIDGCVYMAGPTFAHAAQFLQFQQDIERYDEVDHNGSVFRVPVPYEKQTLYGLEIVRSMLNPSLLHSSHDHVADFFQEDTESFYYEGKIEPEWFILTTECDMNKVKADSN